MLRITIIQLFLSIYFALKSNPHFLAIDYPEPDYDISWRSDCINYPVDVYTYDFNFHQWVVTLNPGDSYKMKSYLGAAFWAVSPSNIFLGNFTVHYDPERKPAIGHGESRHFVIRCPDDYLYLCDTCQPYDPKTFLPASTLSQFGLTLKTPISFSEVDMLGKRRHNHEQSRVKMMEFQPPDIQRFTPTGFKAGYKLKDISPESYEKINEFYQNNKDTPRETKENWDESNTYVHHWKAGVTILHLPADIKTVLWRDLKKTLGEWANVNPDDLEGSSVYGIRRYWNGSILENHVDRGQQLVLSAIINVDQDLEEPWPLQIYDHNKKSYVVFMKPGDVVLYESAVAIHGRPYPLKGKFMANVFAHTKPKGWSYNKGPNEWAHLNSKAGFENHFEQHYMSPHSHQQHV